MSARKPTTAPHVEIARSLNPAKSRQGTVGRRSPPAAKDVKEEEAEGQDPPDDTNKDNLPLDEVIANHVGVLASSLQAHFESSLEELGLDSIGAVQLADQLLARFQLEIHPDELFKTSPSILASCLPAYTTTTTTSHAHTVAITTATTAAGNSKSEQPEKQTPRSFGSKFTSDSAAISRSGDPSSPISSPSVRNGSASSVAAGGEGGEGGGGGSEPPAASHQLVPASPSQLLEAISAASHIPVQQIEDSVRLSDLGLDSFSVLELIDRLEEDGVLDLADQQQPEASWTIRDLIAFMPKASPEGKGKRKESFTTVLGEPGVGGLSADVDAAPEASHADPGSWNKPGAVHASRAAPFWHPFGALGQSDSIYEDAARETGFIEYWDVVGPLQSDIVAAFINEALQNLGVDLSEHPHGVDIPPLPTILPKYTRLMKRLWDVLESQYVVLQRGGKILRGSDRVSPESSASLCRKLRAKHPSYDCEADLLEIVGPALADCLTGKTDPIKLLFGSARSRDVMRTFYTDCPMMSAHMLQLNCFFKYLLHNSDNVAEDQPLRILEIGGGTGGTTAGLLETLEASGVPFRYTFTDIGPSFVSKAKMRWKSLPSMDCAIYDIEQDAPPEFVGQYDIVLGANVVHATSNRMETCRRLRETLLPGGLLVLSEITHPIDWYDICFGLLDGWWLADKGKGYAVQPASVWMDVFERAGFECTAHSGGPTEEANTQQILVARNKWY